jgi:YVTN family beta-propeller protein
MEKKLFFVSLLIGIFIFSCSVMEKAIYPGKTNSGKILLPNGWSLSPAGNSVQIGDLPLGMAITPDESFAVVTNNGYNKPYLSVIDINRREVIQTIKIKNVWLGIKFYNGGKNLAVSGGNENKIYLYDFIKGKLNLSDSIVIGEPYPKENISIAGLDIDKENKILCFVTKENNSFYAVNLETKKIIKIIDLKAQGYTCLISKNSPLIFVSVWGDKKIILIDKNNFEIKNKIEVESHPNDMVEDLEGKRLFVANANENTVSVIDLNQNKVIETIICSLYPDAPCGSTPNSVDISKDGKKLYIANADNNCVPVIDISTYGMSKSIGFISVGWYPTIVRCTGKELIVVNGKGHAGSRANMNGPQPVRMHGINYSQYIGGLFNGSVSFIEYPDATQLANYSKRVYENTPYSDKKNYDNIESNPIPRNISEKSPIKYVFYVIKENRTYDQVFGDISKGNGDPNLCLFPEKITPNHHKLANEFVLFDNFYVDAEVSADGHNWSMGAYATDYVEKTWPTNYGGRGGTYDYEGGKEICSPTKGYIWDYCFRYNVSYRSYGEFIENGKTLQDSGKALVKNLEGHFAPFYRGWDLEFKDIDRIKEWMREFDEYEKNGNLPQFQVIKLPNDHTAGTSKKMRTPFAMVADNDLALGILVERISKSKYWKQSAIFVLEDDAQNGPDHVDAHRSPVLVISPYVKRNYVDSRLYSTSSVLKTMELILGLPPMSQYDAAALPMYNSFTLSPDFIPYEKIIPQIDLNEMNLADAYGQDRCEQFDFTEVDRIPDIEFSEIIWKSIKGRMSNPQSPRRGVFVKY